jgi:hypothetical protein
LAHNYPIAAFTECAVQVALTTGVRSSVAVGIPFFAHKGECFGSITNICNGTALIQDANLQP